MSRQKNDAPPAATSETSEEHNPKPYKNHVQLLLYHKPELNATPRKEDFYGDNANNQ